MLGFEIAEQDFHEEITDLFMFTTSGATLTGLYEAFNHLVMKQSRKQLPAFHAVQTGKAVDLASALDKRPVPDQKQQSSQHAGFGGVKSSSLAPDFVPVFFTQFNLDVGHPIRSKQLFGSELLSLSKNQFWPSYESQNDPKRVERFH